MRLASVDREIQPDALACGDNEWMCHNCLIMFTASIEHMHIEIEDSLYGVCSETCAQGIITAKRETREASRLTVFKAEWIATP